MRFLTGTDEHGLKVAQAAAAAGVPTPQLARRNSDVFQRMQETLNISFDRFIRTTDADHHEASKEIWRRIEAAGDIENPRYMELLMPHYYEHHTLRMPADDWPDPAVRGFAHINQKIYVPMQGPSELGMSADAKLARWDRVPDLPGIEVPALVIGSRYDTMDPAHMEEMAKRLPHGRYLYCPDGSHLTMYDDQRTYFAGLLEFLRSL